MPESVLGMGIRVHPDRRHATVYVPASAATTLANLVDNGQLAPWWPSVAIEFEVADVFTQTPGPDAGERLRG